jgi:uncharacterized membrane protein YhaH (DUF805 family)
MYFCPHCGNKVAIRPEWLGKTLQCPICHNNFICDGNILSKAGYTSSNFNSSDIKPAGFFTALSKYAVFSGRASRREYWLYVIMQNCVMLAAIMVGVIVNADDPMQAAGGTVYLLSMLFFLIPGLAVAVRRCHDTGRSGWWFLINFLPCVGCFIFLFMMCRESEPDNQYGPNPNGNNPEEIWPVVVGLILPFVLYLAPVMLALI